MKKLIALLLIGFGAKAQTFTFKVQPYTFQDETRKSVTVTGIRAKIISNIDCNLSDSTFYRQFYIDFKTTTVESFGALNTDTEKITSELSANTGLARPLAKALVKEICRKLEFGTVAEKYAAAGQLAGGYGYTLKPLAEQK